MLARLGSLSDVSANCLRGPVHWSRSSGADDGGDGGKMMMAQDGDVQLKPRQWLRNGVWGRDNRPKGLMGREEMKSHSAGKKSTPSRIDADADAADGRVQIKLSRLDNQGRAREGTLYQPGAVLEVAQLRTITEVIESQGAKRGWAVSEGTARPTGGKAAAQGCTYLSQIAVLNAWDYKDSADAKEYQHGREEEYRAAAEARDMWRRWRYGVSSTMACLNDGSALISNRVAYRGNWSSMEQRRRLFWGGRLPSASAAWRVETGPGSQPGWEGLDSLEPTSVQGRFFSQGPNRLMIESSRLACLRARGSGANPLLSHVFPIVRCATFAFANRPHSPPCAALQ